MTPPVPDPFTEMIQTFVRFVRRLLATDSPVDPVDRVLAAATLAAGALVMGWPQGRKLPGLLAGVFTLGRALWNRRHWFTGGPA